MTTYFFHILFVSKDMFVAGTARSDDTSGYVLGVVYPALIEIRSGNLGGAFQLAEDYVIELKESSVLGDSLFFTEAWK